MFTRPSMNNIEDDLQRIALQEERLQFDHFDAQTAWDLGSQLRAVAEERQLAIVIDIQLHGLPLFYFARPGTTPDNPEWVRRKRNIVRRFFRSSYAIGLMVKSEKLSLDALDARDYAHHGGSFPIFLKGHRMRWNHHRFRVAPARRPLSGCRDSRRIPPAGYFRPLPLWRTLSAERT